MIAYEAGTSDYLPLVVRKETAEFLELSSEDGTRRFRLTWPEVRMIARAGIHHNHTLHRTAPAIESRCWPNSDELPIASVPIV
jgi:hypothetical protein